MWQAELLLIILLLLLSGFFSGTEASFFALNRVQLRRLERHGEATSKLILEVLSKPNHFLTSVLVGNTLVNVALSVLTTSLFLRLLGDGGGLQVAILVTTVSVLLVGEVTPKTIAVNYPERVSRLTVRALRFVQVLLAPVIGAVTFVSDAILRLFGVEDGGIGHNSAISRGELGSLLEGADREGVMTARESWLAQNILEFSATRAEEAMIPRVDMVAASLEMDRDELEALVLGARRSRIPIYRNTIDEIEGYLPTKEFLLYPETKVSELVRPVAIFSERAFLSQIFYETQKGRTPVTILVNEYGETVGMLTREDLLEELVGEIHDEFGAKEDRFHRLGPGVFSASGQINIEELNEAAGLSIPDEDTVTLNGFLSALHGGIPVKGEEIVWNGIRFQIAEASRHRVQRVRVVVSPEEGA
ncbi:MAG: HlyC/CorC family transporter [Candidatus Eisenbacteria bacterium]|uniref:HlyC/CorC family transporter n=1 Tax=Eiseniibacteriota bacterium TaxID=2212470 RepID=A0A956SDC9_UNCEI|nr:HlyC/CorC family transporter [Candidatus Eisenbacteria bacterium]